MPKEGSRPISTYLAFTKKVRMFTLEVLERNFEIFDLFSTTAFSRNIFEASYVRTSKIYRENAVGQKNCVLAKNFVWCSYFRELHCKNLSIKYLKNCRTQKNFVKMQKQKFFIFTTILGPRKYETELINNSSKRNVQLML